MSPSPLYTITEHPSEVLAGTPKPRKHASNPFSFPALISPRRNTRWPSMTDAARVWTAREMKLRQAAFVYLHAAILREASAYEMWRAGLLPFSPLGSPLPWLFAGAVAAVLVFFGILHWQNL